jgi:hypothetical protein
MDKTQKPSNPECYTPLSEPFRIYSLLLFQRNFLYLLVYSFIKLIKYYTDILTIRDKRTKRGQFKMPFITFIIQKGSENIAELPLSFHRLPYAICSHAPK